MVVRDSATTFHQLNFIPVFEAIGSRRMGMKLENRIRCGHCRRTSSNRGVCVHENAVVHDAKELNSSSIEGEEDKEVGGNRSNSTKVSFVSRLPRRALPRKSDNDASLKFLLSFSNACHGRIRRNEEVPKGVPVNVLEGLGQDFDEDVSSAKLSLYRRGSTGCNTHFTNVLSSCTLSYLARAGH